MASDTRTRMVDTTARLLQQRGYHGTALGDVLTDSGAPRGSLYFHFPGGKDELVAAATRQAVDAITAELRETLGGDLPASKAVRQIMEAAADALATTDYAFGSPVAPIVLDALNDDSEIAEMSRETFATWIGLLEASFVRSGIPARRAGALATLVQASYEGLLVICRATRDTTPMRNAAREMETILSGVARRR
jgi:TetR/AcrR family transcriptional repressor of lmrAB and yxaGH operons